MVLLVVHGLGMAVPHIAYTILTNTLDFITNPTRNIPMGHN